MVFADPRFIRLISMHDFQEKYHTENSFHRAVLTGMSARSISDSNYLIVTLEIASIRIEGFYMTPDDFACIQSWPPGRELIFNAEHQDVFIITDEIDALKGL